MKMNTIQIQYNLSHFNFDYQNNVPQKGLHIICSLTGDNKIAKNIVHDINNIFVILLQGHGQANCEVRGKTRMDLRIAL